MESCQSGCPGAHPVDPVVHPVQMVPQFIDGLSGRSGHLRQLAHGGRIVFFLPIGHALDPVAPSVDSLAGDFHLAST